MQRRYLTSVCVIVRRVIIVVLKIIVGLTGIIVIGHDRNTTRRSQYARAFRLQ